MIVLGWILVIIISLILFVYLYYFIPLRGKEQGFEYVSVNEDGSVWELTRSERGYLTEKFDPTDSGRPYIKTRVYGKYPSCGISGFIPRNRVPRKTIINKIELTNENWRRSWLFAIKDLSNLEYQKANWLNPLNTNPFYSFTEFMGLYFEDLDLTNGYEKHIKNSRLSLEEFEIISDWHQYLSEYKSPNHDDNNSKAILEDDRWLNIIEKGLKTIEYLKPIVNRYDRGLLT